jgi:hypothetical protein
MCNIIIAKVSWPVIKACYNHLHRLDIWTVVTPSPIWYVSRARVQTWQKFGGISSFLFGTLACSGTKARRGDLF